MSRFRARLLLLACAALAPLVPAPLAGQDHPNAERGFNSERGFHAGDVDQVNLFNGNLVLSVPLGMSYPVGGGLSYRLPLVYNSNVWDFQSRQDADGIDRLQALPSRRSNAGLGWLLSLGRLEAPGAVGNNTGRWVYVGPDGATHQFHPKLHEGDAEDGGDSATVQRFRYTGDGTYLRFVDQGAAGMDVEFPSGEVHRFDGQGRLIEIRNRFAPNWIRIAYVSVPNADNPAASHEEWHITDNHERLHKVIFRHDLPAYPAVVDRIELEVFGGKAEYQFEYAVVPLPRSCEDSDPTTGDIDVPLLTGVLLPDQSRYAMPVAGADPSYQLTPSTQFGLCQSLGALQRLTLPTLGRLEWTYQTYVFPNDAAARPPRNRVAGVATRTVRNAAGTQLGQWTYSTFLPSPETPTPGPLFTELVNEVTDPLGHQTKHFFSVYANATASAEGWSTYDYGLPFTRKSTDGAGRFLSREVWSAGGQLLRSEYVRFERDQRRTDTNGLNRNLNRRRVSSRTVYEDDVTSTGEKRFADVDLSDFDGLGHYRRTQTGGNFPGSNVRTTVTTYHPTVGTYQLGADGVALAGYTMLPATSPWVLGTFTRHSVTEGTFREATQAHFNPGTGFLERQRLLLDPDGPGPEDVVAVFTPDGAGNLQREQYYGGDGATLGTGALATLPLPGDQYRIHHAYAFGVLSRSEYANASGTALTFQLLDQTIHKTGLVESSRDVAELSTFYEYDRLGRLLWSKPNEGSWTGMVYNRASSSSSLASVTVRSWPNGVDSGTALAESQTWFDALGRPWRERQLLPGNVWSVRETLYDGAGNRSSVSELQNGNPTKTTQFLSYDPFGRPGIVRPPDGAAHDVAWAYAGASKVDRTVQVATSRAANGQMIETAAKTTEIYDRHGRLFQVTEPSGAAGANVTTEYGYDAMDRLRTVSTTAPANGESITQLRSFVYDGRGFLRSETHPEKGPSGNGTLTYFNHDARGHARRRQDGPSNLTFVFDRAERLGQVLDGSSRKVKEFTYAGGNSGANLRKGKLITASRFQYPLVGGVTREVEIADFYVYAGVGGRVSQRETKMFLDGSLSSSESFRQTFDYTPLGEVRTVGYPVCTHADCFQDRAATFADVPAGHVAQAEIDAIFQAGITGGCQTSPQLQYCPDNTVTRAQMAVFLLTAKEGPGYTPPACTASQFQDVPCSYWAAPWILELARRGVTGGCSPGRYCPEDPVTQAQMSVFLLRTREGSSYFPPACTVQAFDDVPCGYWASSWIGEAARRGLRAGCGNGDYCPEELVTRATMAGLLVRTFGIPMTPAPATGRDVVNTYTAGLLTSVGGYADLSYHPNRMVHQVVRRNGVVDTQANDPNAIHRPASITATAGGVPLWTTGTYSYDGAGNIARLSTALGDSWFTYDKVSRLETATLRLGQTGGGTQVQQTYTFDPFGNLTAISGNRGRSIPVNPRTNRLSSPTAGHDAGGNVTAWNDNDYEYDAFHQMQRMTADEEDWHYFYNADDERIWSYNIPATRSRWTLRDLSGRVLREYENNGGLWSIATDYIYRDGALLAAETPGGVRHLHVDHLGTPRLITNAQGGTAAFHAYYPFGEEATATSQDKLRLKLTGHERDFANETSTEDDLDYMLARHANPLLGRFLSFDPVGGNPRHPQSWNRYAYVLGNPVNLVDPLGLFPVFYDEIFVSATAMWRGIRFTSSPFTADRLYLSSRQFGSLLGAASGGPEPSSFAVAVAREVAYSTGWIADYADRGAMAVNYATGYVDAADALVQGNYTEAGVLVAMAFVPLPGDTAAMAAARRFTPDQDALVALAREAKRRGVDPSEVEILREWSRELGIPFRGPEAHVRRKHGSKPHIHLGPVGHILVRQ